LNGIINIIKPPLLTSFKTVELLKHKFKIRHIGHLGVLDPIATGLLQIAIGDATKLFDYFTNQERVYRVEALFGISTDTQDAAGTPNKFSEKVSLEELKEVLGTFIGEILQVPPMYSTIRYKGRRLYEIAREGKEVPRNPRKVIIKEIKILDVKEDTYPRVTMDVICHRGTYIRTLCYDVGEKLGIGAHMFSLIRMKVGNISVAQAYPLFKILEEKESISKYFMPWKDIDLKKVELITKIQKEQFIGGRPVQLYRPFPFRKEFISVWYDGKCLGIGNISQDILLPIVTEGN
jgi:tRNA pseudouridine55 synthase